MPIDFTLTPHQSDLRKQARDFANDVLADVDALTDGLPTPAERFAATRPIYQEMIRGGFLRRCIPTQFGGDGSGLLDMAVIAEEFYAANCSVALTLFGTVLGLLPIFIAATDAQRRRLLAPFLETSGAPLAAFALSEPGGSANAAAAPPAEGVRTLARKQGGEWIVSGSKHWISSATGWNGHGADLQCVVCRTDPDKAPVNGVTVIAVPGPQAGIILERAYEAMGHRAHLVPLYHFRDVRVSVENTIGSEGDGLSVVAASFQGATALVGIMAVGLMRRAFAFALEFARTERRGGLQPIIEHQAVGYALADAKMSIEAVRHLAWRACQAIDARSPAAVELALHSKIFGSETAVRVVGDLMKIVGIDSYNQALPLAGLMQDAMALPLFGGSNMGVRRRQLHALYMQPDYDPLAVSRGT
jgi:alkylation response protein AidB-like acyl-CoA dehydrogenase